jgi:hypothetical protein
LSPPSADRRSHEPSDERRHWVRTPRQIEAVYLSGGIHGDSHDVRRLLELNPIDIGTAGPDSCELDGLQLTDTREFLMGTGPVGPELRGNYRVDVVIVRLWAARHGQ